jgi:serine phosphatase RsbU (regulator of sigma subunit)/CHASE2 domain-containing sensor protein
VKPFFSDLRRVPRRLLPLVYLIPLAYLLQPVFWTPLDGRFYNFFHSKRPVAPWSEVVVVGIDEATRSEAFTRPIFPLSRHVPEHSAVIRELAEARARAIVFDLEMGSDAYVEPPHELAESIRQAERVFLVMSLGEKRLPTGAGDAIVLQPVRYPDTLLARASRGAYVVDVDADADGIVRRFAPDGRLERLGLETLPERLAGVRHEGPMPIEFPSVDTSIPLLSYLDVLSGDIEEGAVDDKIVFIGLTEDPLTDFVDVPRRQKLGGGAEAFGQSGVVVLAAITETLLRGAPIRDGGWPIVLLWNVLWCAACVAVVSRRRPEFAAFVVLGIMVVALTATGFLHALADLVLPAGLLLGCLFLVGAHAIVTSYVQTSKELHAEEVENERVRKEMETARRTQEGFLPDEIPKVEGLDIWGTNVSSLAVSGDYFDVIDLGEERPLVLAIADVSGKGLPASLLMSNVQAGLHCHVFQDSFDLKKTAENLNRLVHHNTEAGKFVTMFLAEIDKKTHHLRFVRAGHDAPIIMSPDGAERLLEEGTCVFGFFAESECEVAEQDLAGGEILCLYTDGVTEAGDPGANEFEVEGIVRVLREHRDESAEEIGKAIIDAVWSFTGLENQADDITLVILKVLVQ